MKKQVDFDWYCHTKIDVINNAAYELIVALTAKSAPPRKVGDRKKFCVIDVPRQYENHRLSQE